MFRKFVITVLTAQAAVLGAAADAIAETLPPSPAADTPRLRLIASRRLRLQPLIRSPPLCQTRAPGQKRPSRALMVASGYE